MQSQIVHALSQLGITPMAHRVSMTSSMIAGRPALGYAIDFALTPYKQHPPKELTFPSGEELSLDSEVQKMLDKHSEVQKMLDKHAKPTTNSWKHLVRKTINTCIYTVYIVNWGNFGRFSNN